jgi:hypothetical protein
LICSNKNMKRKEEERSIMAEIELNLKPGSATP